MIRSASRRLPRIVPHAAIAAAVLATPAAAAELVPPDPWEVIHLAREFGPAEIARDGMNDPQIRGTIDGLHYRVTFYGCRLGRDCDTILFDARFARQEWLDEPPEPETFTRWNRDKLFGRAWTDSAGRAVLDHPVAMAAGLPTGTLRAVFRRWQSALAEYAAHIGIR